jgi:alpha-beta hydrolase superfamily lysophospholipase
MRVNTRFDDWDLRESGTPDAKHHVLLLAGALLTAASYQELLDEPVLRAASIHVVAATLPGFGRTPAPRKPSVEE